jgi:acyl dehydratase
MEPLIPPAMLDVHRRSASDFAELTQAVRQAGPLDRRPGHYAVRVALTLAVLAGAWTVFVCLGDTWWQVVGLSYGWWVARHSRLVRAGEPLRASAR